MQQSKKFTTSSAQLCTLAKADFPTGWGRIRLDITSLERDWWFFLAQSHIAGQHILFTQLRAFFPHYLAGFVAAFFLQMDLQGLPDTV